MPMKERLLQFLEARNLTKAKFERMCGLANGAIDKMGDSTRRSTFDKISKTFPDLNINWLRVGVGSMLNTQPEIISNGSYNIQAVNSHVSQINGSSRVVKPTIEDEEAVEICSETGVHEGEPIKFVPVIPPKIAQSAEENIWAYVNSNRVPRTPVVEQLPVYDTAYRIKSDAMAPRLRAGDYVALRYIGPHPKILNGEVYAVDLKTSGLVVRELINQPEGYKLRARQERYEDDCVTYEDVMGVYEVVGAVIMNI